MSEPIQVKFAPSFQKDIKRLGKKYPKIKTDLSPLIKQLENGETPGDAIQGVGYEVYKVRVRNSDVQRGKSGGYRVIYYVQTEDAVILLIIYTKSEIEDVDAGQILRAMDNLYLPEE